MNLDISRLSRTSAGRTDDSRHAITVSHVLEMLAGEMTPEEILKDFSYLERADIGAAPEGAARHVAHRVFTLSK
jgi:uncharacterized protein (DUF433 family)